MDNLHFETQCIRIQYERSKNREHSVPLYLTSSFVFNSAEQGAAIFKGEETANLYSRFSNPNTDEFIRKLCLLEKCAAGVSTASGMAAIYTTFAALLKQGDHLVASKAIFGNAHYIITNILPNMGISYTLVDIDDHSQWEEAINKPKTKLVYLESPSNPTLKIADLSFISTLCKSKDVIFAVDNCFASPYLQQPVKFGADVIIHSATKYIDGQGRVLGGAVLATEALALKCYDFIRRTGASLSPFNAWVLSKSLETLAVRMDRHCSNASEIAERLEKHPKVQQVYYPFLKGHPQQHLAKKQMKLGGGLVGFELEGGIAEAQGFLNDLKLHSLTANLGDTRSIATHPATTTHIKLSPEEQLEAGIRPNFLRLSVGLENVEDLWTDIEQAIEIV